MGDIPLAPVDALMPWQARFPSDLAFEVSPSRTASNPKISEIGLTVAHKCGSREPDLRRCLRTANEDITSDWVGVVKISRTSGS